MAQGQTAGNVENNAIGVSETPMNPRKKRGRPFGSGRGRRNTGQGMATTATNTQPGLQQSGIYIKGRANLASLTGEQGWQLRHLCSLAGVEVTS